jgi:NAD-dependent SIR2 family protein deacetylase
MPVFDLKCTSCGKMYEDEWSNDVEELKCVPCVDCKGKREVVIHPIPSKLGISFHEPGVIRQFEMSWTDAEGNRHTEDVRDRARHGSKGKFNHDPSEKNPHGKQ